MKSIGLIYFLTLGLSAAGETTFKTVGHIGADVPTLTIENTYSKGMQAQACSVLADRVAFRSCQIMGWQEWNVKPPLVCFAEYACTGPGAVIGGRVDWAKASEDAAPPEFGREQLMGDLKP